MIRAKKPQDQRRYNVGIDVGERGIGLAAVELDDEDYPIQLLASLTHRIDGGILPGTEKSPQSRKATAGLARRIRRMRKYRKKRLAQLDEKLLELGYPVVDEPQTYEPWQARARLVEQQFEDQDWLKADLSLALRHIARHRGWRNPWLSWTAFTDLQKPSKSHLKNLDGARTRFSTELPAIFTVGQLGSLGADPSIVTRPRTSANSRIRTQGAEPLFKEKVLQEDHLFEVERFWEVQDLLPKEHRKPLVDLVFHQNEPRVPRENVGKDELPGMRKFHRAPRASLEFQEFRIRATVANLQIKEGQAKRPLTEIEYDAVYALLSHWHLSHSPTDTPVWADVAAELDVSPAHLVTPALDDVVGNNPPINRSMDLLLYGVDRLPAKAKKPIRKWVDEADDEQLRMFVSWLNDTTDGKDEVLDRTGLSDTIAEWDENALEKLGDIELENGRAAYSVESLSRLNERMAADRSGLHEARKAEFGVGDEWRPTPPNLDERTEHPTVDQNLTVVRRFLMNAVAQWGLPERVNLEHVRSAFMGAVALADLRAEQRRILRERDRAKEELKGLLPHEPTRRDARRMEYVQRQNSQCAYCGSAITVRDCELDHIVPRAGGGASTRANLVAVCRTCNQSKGRLPFAVWAQREPRPGVGVEEAVARVRNWSERRWTAAARRINRETQLRLKQRESDQPLDERSMESTAYAARALRERIARFLGDAADQQGIEAPEVGVYRGSVVSAARKASGIDSMIRLRGKDIKDRGDFRHHAVDAAVISMMNPAVGQAMAVRDNMRNAAFWAGDQDWAEVWAQTYEPRASYREWKLRSQRLGEVVRDAVRADEIPVINPLRLGRNVGPVHKDTVRPLRRKAVTDKWTLKDAKRIVDKDLYLQVKHALDGGSKPATLPEELVHDLQHRGVGEIEVFDASAPQLVVREGSADFGAIHHARLLAWRGPHGKVQFGMLRVRSGELAKLWPSQSADILTASVPAGSASRRDVPDVLDAKLEAGECAQVGWLTSGDEVELDLVPLRSVGPKPLREFLEVHPNENRWVVQGFYSPTEIILRPLFLSQEGALSAEVNTSPIFSRVFSNKWKLSLSGFLPYATVIRRNSMGEVRRVAGRLPASFSPITEAQRMLR